MKKIILPTEMGARIPSRHLGISASRQIDSYVKSKSAKNRKNYLKYLTLSVSAWTLLTAHASTAVASSAPIGRFDDNTPGVQRFDGPNIYIQTNEVNNAVSLNGNGKVAFSEAGGTLYIGSGDGSFYDGNARSVFSGQIEGKRNFDYSKMPAAGAYGPGIVVGPNGPDLVPGFNGDVWFGNGVSFNTKNSQIRSSSIRNIGLLGFGDFANAVDLNNNIVTGVSYTSVGKGSQVVAGEVLVGGGTDGLASSVPNVSSARATLIVSDKDTSIQTGEACTLAQQLPPQEGGNRLYGKAEGTVWISDGAHIDVKGGGINGGLYLGNAYGNGPDERIDNEYTTNLYRFPSGEGHGVIHITGDQVEYDASGNVVQSGQQGQSSQVNIQNGGLWIGPVDGGKGSGLITVDHGGQLNLENSFTVLGGQNGAGNINIGQGGTATVTGNQPGGITAENTGQTFNTQRQGSMTIADGGALNVGNAQGAGVLRLYGDLNLAKGSTTTFYEGTTTKSGNKGDAFNSYADVHGNVVLDGGSLQIAGISGQNKGQNGAVDAGLYHVLDYTGTLTGLDQNASFTASQAGQAGSYVYDGAAKTLSVLVAAAPAHNQNNNGGSSDNSPHDNGASNAPAQPAAPTSWTGRNATWTAAGISDGSSGGQAAPAILNGAGGTVTVSGAQPVQSSSLIFSSNGYTVVGGALTGALSGNQQNTLSVQTDDGKTGAVASAIVDNGSHAVGLMKTGNGSLTLSGQNSYTGVTGVQNGTLNITSHGDISQSSQVLISKTGAMSVEGRAGKVINNGTLTVSGQVVGDISNSGGTTTVQKSGQIDSLTNSGNGVVTVAGRVTDTLTQQAGTVHLDDGASIGTLATNGTQNIDRMAGLDRTDGKSSAERQAFVDNQLKTVTDPSAKALLTAVRDTMSGSSGAVLSDLKDVGNLFTVASNAHAQIGTLTGYGTGYLGDGSSLMLNGSNTVYGDALFGQGRVIVNGQNLVFHGTNYYSGGTDIAEGASVTAGTQSLGTNEIAIDGAANGKAAGSLTIEENGSNSLDNALSGAGIFNKAGTGVLTLNQSVDDSRFTGTTNVNSGLLEVNNRLGSMTNVHAGAAIAGTGTVGGLTLDKGSTLAVRLSGDANKSGGTVEALHLAQNGKATVNGANVEVNVGNLTGVKLRKDYTTRLLSFKTDGTGFNKNAAFSTAFMKGSVAQDQNGLWDLTYHRYADYGSWAQTTNEYGVAGALTRADNAGATAGFMSALMAMQEGGQARGAYNALSGEINASAKTAMVNDSFYVQEAVVDRLDCAGDTMRALAHDGKQQTSGYCDVNPSSPISVWGTVYGQQGGQSGRSGVASLGQSSVGWIMGADTQINGGWRVGGLMAYGRDWFNVQSGRGSSSHSNTATIGAYVGNAWRVGGLTRDAALTFKGGVSYSWNMLHTNRRVSYADYAGHLSSNNRSGTGQAFAETGYRMRFTSKGGIPFEVEPFARMTYVNYGQDSFREHGADTALNVKGQNSSIGFSTVGVKLATSLHVGKMLFSPHVEAGYRRAFGRTNARVREGFSALGGGYDMAVQGTPLSVDTAQINTGFSAHLNNRIDVTVDYIGQYGNRQTSTGGSGSFRYSF